MCWSMFAKIKDPVFLYPRGRTGVLRAFDHDSPLDLPNFLVKIAVSVNWLDLPKHWRPHCREKPPAPPSFCSLLALTHLQLMLDSAWLYCGSFASLCYVGSMTPVLSLYFTLWAVFYFFSRVDSLLTVPALQDLNPGSSILSQHPFLSILLTASPLWEVLLMIVMPSHLECCHIS